MFRLSALMISFTLPCALYAQTSAGTPPHGPTTDTSVIDSNGTAHITRVVPLPTALSPEAHTRWSKPISDAPQPATTAQQRRPGIDAWQKHAGERSKAVYPVTIIEGTVMGGVPVRIMDPLSEAVVGPISGEGSPGAGTCISLHYSVIKRTNPEINEMCAGQDRAIHKDRVLLCLHGGGFDSDTGSYTEAIPIANLTRTRVVSVLYRLAPEHPYPAALDDAIAVYKELLKTYKPSHIAIYGTSAGAILTGEVAVRLKELNLPQPAALGIFSGFGDMAPSLSDSPALYTFNGLGGHLDVPKPGQPFLADYVGSHDRNDPVLSPNGADLHGLPPTLFVTSGRDLLLSGTADMERAWLRDGVPSQMVMFDGLPHYFWGDVDLPESREAYAVMANFFSQQLGR